MSRRRIAIVLAWPMVLSFPRPMRSKLRLHASRQNACLPAQPTAMQSYVLRIEGSGVVLAKVDAPVPEPAAGQVLLKMLAAGLNRGEFIPGGLVKGGAARPSGIEGAGEVVALGADVTGPAVGSLVMGRCAGAFSEFALMDVREAIAVPPS